MEIKQAKLSFVTDDELIRGFDYRNNPLGFYLLLLNPFIHDRDYEQCIGTVVRYYEPCKLFIDPSVPAVNQTKKLAYLVDLQEPKTPNLPKCRKRRSIILDIAFSN